MARSLKKFTCKQCGVEFKTRNWKSGKDPQFCGVKCRALSQVKYPEQDCIYCGKKFKPKKEGMFFCSMKCFNEHKKSQRIKMTCKNCGKEFLVRKSELESRNILYCSNECKHESQRARTKEKVCPTCGKKFTTFERDDHTYCSNLCNLKSQERKDNLKEKYTNVPLVNRGFTEEQVENFIKNVSLKNGERNLGKTYEEIYGKEKANKISQKLSDAKSGVSLYDLVMDKHNVGYYEARTLMPAYGRTGEKHPMFGKHHTVESKQKMMDSIEKNSLSFNFAKGYFNNIFWQGTWELKFLIDCYENSIKVERWEGKPIPYEFEGKPRHYFPDFVVNGKIVEIKGNESRTATREKKEAAQEIYGDDYVYINDIDQKLSAKVFYKLTEEKYSDILKITYNPYEEEKIGD